MPVEDAHLVSRALEMVLSGEAEDGSLQVRDVLCECENARARMCVHMQISTRCQDKAVEQKLHART